MTRPEPAIRDESGSGDRADREEPGDSPDVARVLSRVQCVDLSSLEVEQTPAAMRECADTRRRSVTGYGKRFTCSCLR